jgi:hypothetical protein
MFIDDLHCGGGGIPWGFRKNQIQKVNKTEEVLTFSAT